MSEQLASRGDPVFAVCFGDGAGLQDKSTTVLPGIDVTCDAAVAKMAASLEERRLPSITSFTSPACSGWTNWANRFRGRAPPNRSEHTGPLRTIQALLGRLCRRRR
jgi:hypothetical protein